jgi:cation transport ATPase
MSEPSRETGSSSPETWLAQTSSLGVDPTKAKIQIETEAEVNARLAREGETHRTKQLKERTGFVISMTIVIILLFFSLYQIQDPRSLKENKDWAKVTLTSILGAVGGYAFGKGSTS